MRHPFSYLIRKAFREVVRDLRDVAVTPAKQESRRKFLKQSAFAGAGLLIAPSLLKAGTADKKIVIIGAGMAGLNAAYQLQKKGINAEVYEAADRTGGRMYTMHDRFGKGITTDIGGEFVDTTHEDILQLAGEFGVDFYDLRKDLLESHAYYFDGRLLSKEELKNALKPFAQKIEADIHSLPEQINCTTAKDFEQLDKISITEYLQQLGISGWLYKLIDVVLTREYGMEASEQSLINFLIMFKEPEEEHGDYTLFGDEHEVYKIKGGSQHLTNQLYEKVKPLVKLKHRLTALRQEGDQYQLQFASASGNKTVRADYVIIAIPFSILRNIKMEVVMPAEKKKCIDELGYGNSCKFIMGLNNKPWRENKQQGYTFNDLSFGCGWDSSQAQSEKQGSFTVFGGGNFAEKIFATKEIELGSDFIQSLDVIYAGSKAAYTNKQVKFCWGRNPLSKGGYSSFKKGQWSTLAGWEEVPVGNIFFAGEHVSLDFQGYMNGAAKTGRVAAEKIISKLKIPVEETQGKIA